jgi:hypothetical protein
VVGYKYVIPSDRARPHIRLLPPVSIMLPGPLFGRPVLRSFSIQCCDSKTRQFSGRPREEIKLVGLLKPLRHRSNPVQRGNLAGFAANARLGLLNSLVHCQGWPAWPAKMQQRYRKTHLVSIGHVLNNAKTQASFCQVFLFDEYSRSVPANSRQGITT